MTIYAYLKNDYPVPVPQQMESVLTFKCENFFVESSDFFDKSQLNNLLSVLKRNDVLVVADIRVFTLSLKEFHEFFLFLTNKAIRFISLADQIDSDRPMAFYPLVELLVRATTARSTHRKVEKELGRPKINEKIINEIQFLYHKRGLTMREIADKTDVALGTVYKYTTLYDKNRKE